MAKAILVSLAVVAFLATTSFSAFIQLGPFYFSDNTLPWVEARQACRDTNRSLVSVDSADKDRNLVRLLRASGNGAIENSTVIKGQSWSSGHEVAEGVWEWDSTHEPFFYTRWFVGQPDALDDINCVYLATRGVSDLYWRDANCSAAMHFICE
ncbi:unnamed protein product [Allacma fusca]|uniref:C-type lectin domain-containing protein n=1 Tax=Allacma fusca TaxID=39272 RepID=A0A8J2JUW0_9HEXA|nr:unnamed protein product [Allacma fusca]